MCALFLFLNFEQINCHHAADSYWLLVPLHGTACRQTFEPIHLGKKFNTTLATGIRRIQPRREIKHGAMQGEPAGPMLSSQNLVVWATIHLAPLIIGLQSINSQEN